MAKMTNMYSLVVIVTTILTAEAVYFTQKQFSMCLPTNSKFGAVIGRVFAYTNYHDNCINKTLAYDVLDDTIGLKVNGTGWIIVDTELNANATGQNTVGIRAQCFTLNGSAIAATSNVNIIFMTAANSVDKSATAATSSKNESTTTATSSVNLTFAASQQYIDSSKVPLSDDEVYNTCFCGFTDEFYVEENVKDIALGRINNCVRENDVDITYTVGKPRNRLTVNQMTTELWITRPLDRETLRIVNADGKKEQITGVQRLRVICELTKENVTYSPQKRVISIKVLDVNDNPPTFPDNSNKQTVEEVINIKPGQDEYSIKKVIEDKDLWTNGSHTFKVLGDSLDVCKPRFNCYMTQLGKILCSLQINLENIDKINDTLYHCDVAVVDRGFMPTAGSTLTNTATVKVNVYKNSDSSPAVLPLTKPLTTNFYRNATRLARLLQVNNDRNRRSRTTYTINSDIFDITREEGIVYVTNTDALATAADTISLHVSQTAGPDTDIIVNMFGTARQETICDEGCSRYKTAESCIGSCGFGLHDGGCVMRGDDKNARMAGDYGTCTYDTKFCPNRQCDELETMFPWLCPQDCTTNFQGAFVLNTKTNLGIMMAESPCWCEGEYNYDTDDYDYDDVTITCFCFPQTQYDASQDSQIGLKSTSTDNARTISDSTSQVGYTIQNTLTSTEEAITAIDNRTNKSQMIALATEESRTTCDNTCRIAIGLGSAAFIIISFTLFMLWFTKKRSDRRKNNLKHVNSVVSMSAMPSDYVEDRERRMSYSSPQWSPKGPIYMSQVQSLQIENSKWEIPRENLTLDKTLGEGEFGLVVKAKAVGIDGANTVKDVAVKMLKHCSTQLEEQDLWSEFNLLTDVSHPSVIRLLGACTSDGPFYLIVEYCEHGCLLKYLRRSRLEENGYVNTRIRFKSPNPKDQTDQTLDGDLLTMRDLLSFAWQIAKGMAYLSEIKLVHRDLAARNVLVASGKMLKISDFGLTRDVYEADTYLKKSRGRIPVKWLAPESLYAQIYTTRSDVWSYGIVLWEIVTLGSPPYPGIPPERLYNLLIGGYRMDRPENCQDEMYAVMQKCWKIDAAERPSFASLALIFDRILQEKTGYLDLTQMDRQVPDLYSKCFDASIQDETNENSNTTDAESDITVETANDPIENMNIKTVCNETYTSETYLTPVCVTQQDKVEALHPQQKDDVNASPVKPDELNTQSTTQEEEDVYTVPLSGNDIQNNQTDSLPPNCETIVTVKNECNDDEPLFKKKIPDTVGGVNATKCNKNKNVIYPSENLSLLMDNGTARFVNINENVDE